MAKMELIMERRKLVEFDGFADEMYRLIRAIVGDNSGDGAASHANLAELVNQVAKYHANCWMHEKFSQIYGHFRLDMMATQLNQLAKRVREQPGLVGAGLSTLYPVDFGADYDAAAGTNSDGATAGSASLPLAPAALTGLIGHFVALVVLLKQSATTDGNAPTPLLAPHPAVAAFVAARAPPVDAPRTDLAHLAHLAGRCFEHAHAHPVGEAAEIGAFVDSQAEPLLRPVLEQACAIAPEVCPPLNRLFEKA